VRRITAMLSRISKWMSGVLRFMVKDFRDRGRVCWVAFLLRLNYGYEK
jgi:hypothetical protein